MVKPANIPVRRVELDILMRQSMLAAGVPEDVAATYSRGVRERFMAKFVLACLERERVEVRGLMRGKLNERWTRKLELWLSVPVIKEVDNARPGFFEDYADRREYSD